MTSETVVRAHVTSCLLASIRLAYHLRMYGISDSDCIQAVGAAEVLIQAGGRPQGISGPTATQSGCCLTAFDWLSVLLFCVGLRVGWKPILTYVTQKKIIATISWEAGSSKAVQGLRDSRLRWAAARRSSPGS